MGFRGGLEKWGLGLVLCLMVGISGNELDYEEAELDNGYNEEETNTTTENIDIISLSRIRRYDPTMSLDPRNEDQIKDALNQIFAGRRLDLMQPKDFEQLLITNSASLTKLNTALTRLQQLSSSGLPPMPDYYFDDVVGDITKLVNMFTRSTDDDGGIRILTRTDSDDGSVTIPTRTDIDDNGVTIPTRTDSDDGGVRIPTHTSDHDVVRILTRTDSDDGAVIIPSRTDSDDGGVRILTKTDDNDQNDDDENTIETATRTTRVDDRSLLGKPTRARKPTALLTTRKRYTIPAMFYIRNFFNNAENDNTNAKKPERDDTDDKKADSDGTNNEDIDSGDTKNEDADSGDTKNEDADSGDTKNDDADSGDTKNDDADSGDTKNNDTNSDDTNKKNVESDNDALPVNETTTTTMGVITCPTLPTTTTTTTTTTVRTTMAFDVEKFLEIVANLTYDYYTNLTMKLNITLQRMSAPTCPPPPPPTTEVDYSVYNDSLRAKCFVCGLNTSGVPWDADCADAFAGDFIPLVPQSPRAKGSIGKFRKYCVFQDVNNYFLNESLTRMMFGRWTGGCSVRWTDVSGIYTQRTCRSKYKAVVGTSYASKRMAKLEMTLQNTDNGCVISPVATLLPLSRAISLYSRFHVCVCTGNWCNAAPAPLTAILSTVPASILFAMIVTVVMKIVTS